MKPKPFLAICVGLIVLGPALMVVYKVLEIPLEPNIMLYSASLGLPLITGLILIKIGVILGILFADSKPD